MNRSIIHTSKPSEIAENGRNELDRAEDGINGHQKTLISRLYSPLRTRVYQMTAGLTSTCPQTEKDDLTYRYPYAPNPISSLSRNAAPSMSFTNSLMPPPTTFPANTKWHTNLLFDPSGLSASTSGILSQLPLLPLPFTFLAAPVNIMVNQYKDYVWSAQQMSQPILAFWAGFIM